MPICDAQIGLSRLCPVLALADEWAMSAYQRTARVPPTQPARIPERARMTAFSAKTTATLNSVSPSALWVESVGANAMNFIAGLQSFSDPVDEAPLKRIEALSEIGLFFICAEQRGQAGKQSQAPKQVLGVVTLHAVCEE